jgi:hypothetical protein
MLPSLEVYAGESADELMAHEGRYRIDSLVAAFDSAILCKQASRRLLSTTERVVLAVEALEREVNNGGYEQFFSNSSKQYAATIVEALVQIGCPRCADITRAAIAELHVLGALTAAAIDHVLAVEDPDLTPEN